MPIEKFFNAKSFAVIGASRDSKKVGNIIFKNLLKSNLDVFPINPKAEIIVGHHAYPDILSLPYKIDCAVIAVKSEQVPDILYECGKKQVKSAVVISAGFSESGNLELENEIKKIAEQFNITLLGPNVLGFLDTSRHINATFFRGMPNLGKLAFISQSGALGVGILDKFIQQNLGLSSFVSIGNSASTDFSDFIEYFSKDKNTEIIALYIESLKQNRGQRFLDVCRKCRKPIFAIKSGKTEAGQKASQSHTAALATNPKIYSGIFQQAGIIEIENIMQLINIAKLYKKFHNLKKACIVTNAGGLGVLTADYLAQKNIQIPKLPENITKKLSEFLPTSWSKNNPVDLIGDALAETYEKTILVLDNQNFFDFFIILLTPQHMTQPLETAQLLIKLKKPVIACFLGGNQVSQALLFLKQNNIPFFTEPQDIAEVLDKLK